MRLPKRKSEQDRQALQSNDPIFLTKESIEKIHRQIERIEVDLPAAIEELQRTREMGDLSENAAYQEAKHQVRRMQTKKILLEERLKNVIEIKKSQSDRAQLGSSITVQSELGEQTFDLVDPLEADPIKGRISYKSPLGQALIGKMAGEQAVFHSPSGERTYTIITLE